MAKMIDAAELMAQLHLMSACAGGMSGPAVLKWVIRTVEAMADER
jgi:hypothetical protein